MCRLRKLGLLYIVSMLVVMSLLGACAKEVVKEVPVERVVEKQVVKEVPVEKVVEKEVIREVPVERVVIREVAPRQKVNVPILSGKLGGGAYQSGLAIAEVLNRKHAWIRAENMEVSGSLEALDRSAKTPDLRKNALIIMSDLSYAWSQLGMAPYNRPEFKEPMPVMYVSGAVVSFVTLDPKIKTADDLVGKRIGFTPVGHSMTNILELLLKAWGVDGKVKVSNMSWAPITEGLADGLLDAGVAMVGMIAPSGKISTSSSLMELAAKRKVYYDAPVITQEHIDWIFKNSPFRPGTVSIAAGAALADQPAIPVAFLAAGMAWGAWPEASEELVYEIAKTVSENEQTYKEYDSSGEGLSAKSMGGYLWVGAEKAHPGAVRLYNEKNVGVNSLW